MMLKGSQLKTRLKKRRRKKRKRKKKKKKRLNAPVRKLEVSEWELDFSLFALFVLFVFSFCFSSVHLFVLITQGNS